MTDEGRLVAGRYRLTEQIGRGGMGTVWRVQDEVLGRQVALKRLHVQPHLADGELATLYERMRREARSAARIVHPNVVVVHDVVDDDGRPCVVMEYVPAGTLGDLLKQHGSIPPREAARIGLGMLAALRAAHAAGVLHRDVKPGNVMLGAEGRVVLTDFGIAMTADTSTLTKTGEMVGSLPYMAPERVRGQKPGPASDLWALGATLYQAVEGRTPFHRDTAIEAAYAIAVDPLEPMRQAGPLAPLIEALLSKEPDERPSAEQTERALRAARAEQAEQAEQATQATQASGSTEPAGPTVVVPSASVAGPSAGQDGEAPARPSGGETVTAKATRAGGGRARRRGGKRRVLVTTTAAAAVAAAAIAGALYATSDHGTGARKSPGAGTSPYTPPPVPEGFHEVSDIGASFPVPDGWKAIKRTGEFVTYADASGRVGITVKMVEPAGSNPMAHFADMEANTKANYAVYQRLRMQQTTFREQPAVVWEFTFQGKSRKYRAIEQGFGRAGGREYDIYLSAPDAQWDTYRPLFDTCTDGFTTSRK
ncbi:serine/threonine-protein kinase [Streptomyces natalensis]|uniref:non-specific serine/threonine protein kinase n=1 Tax=Streptomyces natalensis ATCC 27448 TaxID=1240678 RepID=A0A0D7CSL6_9ACTN|nr:serine/threonine-protein kinase [Streptomyces natalensis]KIZ19208.1 serine/threonine protein phosphatase [Streptomyces natalensis ATCC 27448]